MRYDPSPPAQASPCEVPAPLARFRITVPYLLKASLLTCLVRVPGSWQPLFPQVTQGLQWLPRTLSLGLLVNRPRRCLVLPRSPLPTSVTVLLRASLTGLSLPGSEAHPPPRNMQGLKCFALTAMSLFLQLFSLWGSPNRLRVLLSATALRSRLPPSRVKCGPPLLLVALTRVIGLKCLTPIHIGCLSRGLLFRTCLFIPRLDPALTAPLIRGLKLP